MLKTRSEWMIRDDGVIPFMPEVCTVNQRGVYAYRSWFSPAFKAGRGRLAWIRFRRGGFNGDLVCCLAGGGSGILAPEDKADGRANQRKNKRVYRCAKVVGRAPGPHQVHTESKNRDGQVERAGPGDGLVIAA